jgi:EAL domain-containing protein (putative c-di-GMP-specific phosphodiesterase class I)
LDNTLTSSIHEDPARRALASALVAFAKDIGATIIAEGIETTHELAALRALGIPWGQGYFLGRPELAVSAPPLSEEYGNAQVR